MDVFLSSARDAMSSRGERTLSSSSQVQYEPLDRRDDEEEMRILSLAARRQQKVQTLRTRPVDLARSESEAFTFHKMQLAFARTTVGITAREEGECKIEESVYGAAIVMPQLARTVGWNKTMSTLAIQSWTFLFFNILLQAYLLRMLAKEETVMDGFAGQMNLCDFGAFIEECPGPGCRGPDGTQYSGPRLYSWNAIIERKFLKDSFKAMFPDRVQEIDEKIDPGEYGLESYWCRFTCCIVFMISCMGELLIIGKMLHLLYQIPTKAEAWLLPKPETDAPLEGSIDEVTVRIAGMPLFWKLFNLAIVVLPKFMLWKLTCETGITILMETSGIEDIITNSVSLTFILGIDELIGSALMSEVTLDLVRATESVALFDRKTSCVGDMSLLSEDELLQKYQEVQWKYTCWDFYNLLPMNLIGSIFGTCFFCAEYYFKHCTPDTEDGGRLVSKTMHQPKSLEFGWLNAFLPFFFPIEYEDTPYWKTPTP